MSTTLGLGLGLGNGWSSCSRNVKTQIHRQNESTNFITINSRIPRRRLLLISSFAASGDGGDVNIGSGGENLVDGKTSGVVVSGTTARRRRLLKVREEKRKREYDRLHNYPAWAKVLEDACKHDEELRAVLGGVCGNWLTCS